MEANLYPLSGRGILISVNIYLDSILTTLTCEGHLFLFCCFYFIFEENTMARKLPSHVTIENIL